MSLTIGRTRRRSMTPARDCVRSLSLLAALWPAATPAQDPIDSGSGAVALEEVIVTARKTEEDVQEIPMSVQVLTAGFLDMTDPTHIFDLQYNVPGLVVNNLGLNGAGFSLRGIADQGGSGLSVASHLNGVYLGNSNLSTARMFDLDRIEVLKGPQGTLYGRNATGGLINFITHSPEREFSAGFEAAYGSFRTGRLQGQVNLPFDGSALRLAFVGSEGDGFIRNSVDDRRFAANDFWGLRVAYLFDATDDLRVSVTAQRVRDDGAVGELWLPNPAYLADPADIRLTTVTLENPFLINESDSVIAEIEYDFAYATLHSVSSYARNRILDVDDCAGLPFLSGCMRSALPSRYEQVSQEFRLVSEDSATIDWLVGAYYYDEDSTRHYFQMTPAINPSPTIDRTEWSTEVAYAVFGQATWSFADRWAVTAGTRLSSERHKLSTTGTGTEDSPTPVRAAKSWDNPSWRLDLQYAPSDRILVYSGISTGFKSGGFTIQPGGVLDGFDPEHLTAIEAGFKSQSRDRRLTLNGAVFYYDFRDLQVNTFTIADGRFVFETDNAAKAEIYGIDADGTFRISDRLTLSGGVVWLPKREFTEYRNDQSGDILSGNKLSRSPKWTVSTAVDYDQPLQGIGVLSARIEYNYRSDFYYTIENTALFSQSAFGLLNLFLRFEPPSEKWYVFASGRNLGDERYFNQVFIQASPGEPDTYEAGFGYRF